MSTARKPQTFGPRFAVRVRGRDAAGKLTVAVISRHGRLEGAYEGMCGVIKQWAVSHGAIQPGTSIVIVDTHDGGAIARIEYLGFGDTLI